MSFIDLLFPIDELQALGNQWPESVNKRRKIDSGSHDSPLPPHQKRAPSTDQRRYTVSNAMQRDRTITPMIQANTTFRRTHSQSDSKAIPEPKVAPFSLSTNPTRKSSLPTFIEPSILRNYLHHLHPTDRSRYSIPGGLEPENGPSPTELGVKRIVHPEETTGSPPSLVPDTASLSGSDHCPTPPAGAYDQLRPGPFGHLIHGLRLTEQERDMVQNLLGTDDGSAPARQNEGTGMKRKTSEGEPNPRASDVRNFHQDLLQRMFPPEASAFNLKVEDEHSYPNRDDPDVHSSGLSPAVETEEEEEEEEDPVPTHRGFAISVDDFINLEEAMD